MKSIDWSGWAIALFVVVVFGGLIAKAFYDAYRWPSGTVEFVTEHEGTRVYRIRDGADWHYFTGNQKQ